MLKKVFFGVLLTAICLSIVFLAGELGLRIYYGFKPQKRPVFLPDNQLGHIHNPHIQFQVFSDDQKTLISHRTNSLGLLGEEVRLPKPQGTFRVLVLGDSFTEALQVADNKNFCHLLGKSLNADVINAGVSAYSPMASYQLYCKRLKDLQPDLVILQLFANDVFEDNRLKAMNVMDDEGMPIFLRRYFQESKSQAYFKLPDLLLRHSRLLEFIYVKWHGRHKRSAYHKQMTDRLEFQEGQQFFMIQPGHSFYQDRNFLGKVTEQTTQYILGIKRLAESQNAKFMMVYVPMETQLKLDVYGEHSKMFTVGAWGNGMNDYLKNLSEKKAIPYLDLLPVFEKNKALGLYLSRDGHLTENGHKIAAQGLTEFINFFVTF